MISSQYLVFSFLIIAIGLRVLAQAALASRALETLLVVAGFAVLVDLIATAVITNHTPQFDICSLL